MTAVAERCVRCRQGARPFLVGDEDLRDVAGHHDHVDAEGWGIVCCGVDPMHRFGAGFRSGDGERRGCRIEADDTEPTLRQPTREFTGAAADIEHTRCSQLRDDRLVVVEVVTLAVEVVVDLGQAWIRENRVRVAGWSGRCGGCRGARRMFGTAHEITASSYTRSSAAP